MQIDKDAQTKEYAAINEVGTDSLSFEFGEINDQLAKFTLNETEEHSRATIFSRLLVKGSHCESPLNATVCKVLFASIYIYIYVTI